MRLTWRHHHRLVKTLRVMEARPAETPAQASDMKLSFGFAGLTFAPAATVFFSLHFFHKNDDLVLPRARRWLQWDNGIVRCGAFVGRLVAVQ